MTKTPLIQLTEQLALHASQRQRGHDVIPDNAPQKVPTWPDTTRGIPNHFARSALFSVRPPNEPRARYVKEPIYAAKGITITYTGEELREETDKDVWLAITHVLRDQPQGGCVTFSGHEMLRVLGWNRSRQSYTRLRESIARMREGSFWVGTNDDRPGRRLGVGDNLINSLSWADSAGGNTIEAIQTGRLATTEEMQTTWEVWVSSKMLALWCPNEYTLLDVAQRMCLPPLGKWLHAYYSTHREPFPHTVKELRLRSGSSARNLPQFRQRLKRVHDHLLRVGFLDTWDLDTHRDVFVVSRSE